MDSGHLNEIFRIKHMKVSDNSARRNCD